ncbi:MAG: hypothetical protein AAF585_21890, partial [Verrucomicrobiota bacterium]
EDKKARKQVFYLVRKNRFYKLIAASDEEAELIKMIEETRPSLTGEGKTDPRLLDNLVERIRSRQPMFKVKR